MRATTEKKEGDEPAWYKRPWVLAAAALAIVLVLNVVFFQGVRVSDGREYEEEERVPEHSGTGHGFAVGFYIAAVLLIFGACSWSPSAAWSWASASLPPADVPPDRPAAQVREKLGSRKSPKPRPAADQEQRHAEIKHAPVRSLTCSAWMIVVAYPFWPTRGRGALEEDGDAEEAGLERPFSWWQTGVIYQVYPRSFADASGDGVGDLRGISSKLGYFSWLGVDAVWLSPIFPSPMADFGYDVADYTGIHPLFGTMGDFEDLVSEAHRRGIKVILDLVPNHTSDEHPWFVESRSSRENPRRDWYLWRDPKPDGSPPNNWESIFGGGAWEWDERTGQYYLHTFHAKQPDLNWRNARVREAMYGVMRFWFERGVDGFRIDALSFIFKDEGLRDNPPNPGWRPGDPPWARQRRVHSDDLPEVLGVVREMREVADEYDERVLIGELYLPLERLMAYYGTELDGLHLPFNFGLVELAEWGPREIRRLVEGYEAALPQGAWPNWVLGNHDNPRIASRLGPARARVAQMLLLTLRGVPTCYYGDEIGMQDVKIPPRLVRDPQSSNSPGEGRDPARTPMQWDAGPNAGFCPEGVEPWLPVAGDSGVVNVETQSGDPRSMLALFRRLIRLRRRLLALAAGSYHPFDAGDGPVYAYLREHGEQRVLVALNFGTERTVLDLSEAGREGEVLCSTFMDRSGRLKLGALALRPDEGLLVSL